MRVRILGKILGQVHLIDSTGQSKLLKWAETTNLLAFYRHEQVHLKISYEEASKYCLVLNIGLQKKLNDSAKILSIYVEFRLKVN